MQAPSQAAQTTASAALVSKNSFTSGATAGLAASVAAPMTSSHNKLSQEVNQDKYSAEQFETADDSLLRKKKIRKKKRDKLL